MSRKGSSKKRKHSVHWFRKGLRLSDNPALLRAVRRCESWRCIFILDPWFAGSSNVGTNKWRFLLQCLEDLDSSLRKLNSRLFVVRGQPADVLPTLFREWGTTYFSFEEDPEPFGRVRDQNIIAMCKEMGIVVAKEHSHTLYNLDRIIEKNGGKAPLTYKRFQTIVQSMDPPPKPVPTLTLQALGNATSPVAADHDEKYGVPSLEELGFDCDNLKPTVWVGGETEALARLERHLERKAWVASFGRPKMTPQSLLASQTGVSPYLRFGCLSTRLFYHALSDLYRRIKKCEPPLSLHGQLLWREFFYTASTKNPNFDKMIGNPICVQIPWDKNDEALAKWANAHTGFPWIDAIMTQLREEGWIHHLARHAVACFLTRGDLWISWEEGMKVFDELLLDADWSVNAGTWLWLSCSSFFQQFFHCYCPVKFGRKADANGDFIRRYIPVLKNFPTRYIHEPWTAPEAVQKSAKCIIGVDYPKPMCNHAHVSKLNMDRMKQVYQQLAHYNQTGLPPHPGQNMPHDLLAELPKIPKISSGGGGGVVEGSGILMGPPPDPPEIKHKTEDDDESRLLVGGASASSAAGSLSSRSHHGGGGGVITTAVGGVVSGSMIQANQFHHPQFQPPHPSHQHHHHPQHTSTAAVLRQGGGSSAVVHKQQPNTDPQQQFRYQTFQGSVADRRLQDEGSLPLLSADMLLPISDAVPTTISPGASYPQPQGVVAVSSAISSVGLPPPNVSVGGGGVGGLASIPPTTFSYPSGMVQLTSSSSNFPNVMYSAPLSTSSAAPQVQFILPPQHTQQPLHQASPNSTSTSVPQQQQAPANANFSSQQAAPPPPLFAANNGGGGDLVGGSGAAGFVGAGMVQVAGGTNGNLSSSPLVGGVVGPSTISPRTPTAATNRQLAASATNTAEQLRRGAASATGGVADGSMSAATAAVISGSTDGSSGGGVVSGGVLNPSPDGAGGMRGGVAGASPGPVSLPSLHRLPPQDVGGLHPLISSSVAHLPASHVDSVTFSSAHSVSMSSGGSMMILGGSNSNNTRGPPSTPSPVLGGPPPPQQQQHRRIVSAAAQSSSSVELNQNLVPSIPGYEAAIPEEFPQQQQK
eukprot:TRINITY_DN2820_c0_g1_i12.p1 TRINITY_DN2820_c0_g1~~TRINITY_DN2820_c0_g1_i12.p1  ORF type:complete len:1093 (-),score=297.82 TRINITY_DN2820_c0_g1_i12:127-3405(-)